MLMRVHASYIAYCYRIYNTYILYTLYVSLIYLYSYIFYILYNVYYYFSFPWVKYQNIRNYVQFYVSYTSLKLFKNELLDVR